MTAIEARSDIFAATRPLLFSIAYRMLGAASESVCSIRLGLFVLPISLNDLDRHRPLPGPSPRL